MALFPLKDDNPLTRIPFQYLTAVLVGICVVVFLWQVSLAAEGETAILGLSVEAPEHLARDDWDRIDYVGAGPVFATATKPDHATPLGWDGLARLCALAPVPAVAIGGVKTGHAGLAKGAGAAGLAMVSEIFASADPEAATRAAVTAWRDA